MDVPTAALQQKLEQLLREAARVAVALDRANGTVVGVPHYSVIESSAHEMGRKLSRTIQATHMGELASHATVAVKCPECGTRCQVVPKQRQANSVDGPLSFDEPTARCPRCRRGFFPPPGSVGP
jgi:DNA-directed RNA polymerase subunit RPC12/RpoP